MNTTLDTVQAALIHANPDLYTDDEWDFAIDRLVNEVTEKDRQQVCPQLAAAARILADEVVRLRAELNTNKTIIEHELNTVLSDCCEAKAVVAGKPGSTQWYTCSECCQPCDVFIKTTTQQPQ